MLPDLAPSQLLIPAHKKRRLGWLSSRSDVSVSAMRPQGSPSDLERRRLRAMRLLDGGHTVTEIARIVGVHRGSVYRWIDARDEQGLDGLRARPSPGRPPRLSEEQGSELVTLLTQGARAHGWQTDLWTCPRIAQVIESHFGVRYHVDHIGRLMHSVGWSHQRPTRRAKQRDEEAIAQWVKTDWPRIKKTPAAKGRTSSSSTSRASRSRRR